MDHQRTIEILIDIHADIPRQGPGADEHTLRALGRLDGISPASRILDVGCGSGAQTLALARATGATIGAVDFSERYLQDLDARAAAQGLSERIRTRVGDMGALDVEPGSLDLIWAEGSIYVIGFSDGLKLWRPLLRPRGQIAVSEACWLTADPSPACRQFWAEGYPAIASIDEKLALIEVAGYEPLGHFAEPDQVFEEFYVSVEARLPLMREKYAGDEEALAIVAESRREIELFRAYRGEYGYVFFTMRRTD